MEPNLDTTARMEVILFSEGAPVAKKRLIQLLDIAPGELGPAIAELRSRKEGSGIGVIETETEVALAVAPAATATIEKIFERELGKDIGDAGLEVLSILLYRGASTRAEIDYIRGVNTSWTVRMLTARGLIERVANPTDGREYLYRPSAELLAHLGVTHVEELPEYAKIASELAAFEQKSGPFEDHATTDPESSS